MPRYALGLLLVCIGLATWTLLQPTDSASNIEGGPVEDISTSQASAAGTGPMEAASGADSDPLHASEQDIQRTESIGPLASDPSPEHSFRLRVIAASDQEPMQGAEVFLLPAPAEDPSRPAPGRDGILASAFDAVALGASGPFQSDADGFVQLPEPEDGTTFLARIEEKELYGSWQPASDARQSAQVIALYEDPPILIKVRDHAGQPVEGYPIALQTGGSTLRPYLYAISDAQGLAELHTPRLHMNQDVQQPFRLGSMIQGRLPEWGPLPFAELPREETLTAAAAASLTVHVRTPDGQPFLGLTEVNLAYRKKRPRTSWTRTLSIEDAGVVHFPLVAPETEMRITAKYLNGRNSQSRESFTTPGAGQEHVIELNAPSEEIAMALRLEDTEGNPLALGKTYVDWGAVSLESGKRERIAREAAETDEAGNLSILLLPTADLEQGYGEQDLVVHWTDPDLGLRWTGHAALGIAQADLELPFHSIEMEADPILAAGHVLDSEGRPIEGARIEIQEAGMDHGWASTYGRRVDSAADGSFVIQGEIPEASLEFKTYWDGYRVAPIGVDPGREDHLIQVKPREHVIEGMLLLPAFLEAHYVHFSDGEEDFTSTIEIHGGVAHFQVRTTGPAPGTLTLSGRPLGAMATLEKVAPVLPGQPSDPRLAPWDLRSEFGLAEVELRLGSETLQDFEVKAPLTSNGRTRSRSIEIYTEWGQRFLIPGTEGIRATVSHERIRPLEVELRPGKQVLQATTPMEIRFHLPPSLVLPEDMSLSLRGRRKQRHDLERSFYLELQQGEGIQTFQLEGAWTCSLRVRGTDDSRRQRSITVPLDLERGRELSFEVQDTGTRQVILVPVKQEALDQAIQKARQ